MNGHRGPIYLLGPRPPQDLLIYSSAAFHEGRIARYKRSKPILGRQLNAVRGASSLLVIDPQGDAVCFSDKGFQPATCFLNKARAVTFKHTSSPEGSSASRIADPGSNRRHVPTIAVAPRTQLCNTHILFKRQGLV